MFCLSVHLSFCVSFRLSVCMLLYLLRNVEQERPSSSIQEDDLYLAPDDTQGMKNTKILTLYL